MSFLKIFFLFANIGMCFYCFKGMRGTWTTDQKKYIVLPEKKCCHEKIQIGFFIGEISYLF